MKNAFILFLARHFHSHSSASSFQAKVSFSPNELHSFISYASLVGTVCLFASSYRLGAFDVERLSAPVVALSPFVLWETKMQLELDFLPCPEILQTILKFASHSIHINKQPNKSNKHVPFLLETNHDLFGFLNRSFYSSITLKCQSKWIARRCRLEKNHEIVIHSFYKLLKCIIKNRMGVWIFLIYEFGWNFDFEGRFWRNLACFWFVFYLQMADFWLVVVRWVVRYVGAALQNEIHGCWLKVPFVWFLATMLLP